MWVVVVLVGGCRWIRGEGEQRYVCIAVEFLCGTCNDNKSILMIFFQEQIDTNTSSLHAKEKKSGN